MRCIKANSIHVEVVRSRLKAQSKVSHQTVGFETLKTGEQVASIIPILSANEVV